MIEGFGRRRGFWVEPSPCRRYLPVGPVHILLRGRMTIRCLPKKIDWIFWMELVFIYCKRDVTKRFWVETVGVPGICLPRAVATQYILRFEVQV